MTKKLKRICENVFDVMAETRFKDQAANALRRDLKNHNISVSPDSGVIEICDREATKVLYTIHFKKGGTHE